MKKLFCLFVIIILVSCNKKNENRHSNETILNEKYTSLSDPEKLKYLDSINQKINVRENDSLKTRQLFEIVDEYFKLKNNKSSFKVSRDIYQNAIKDKDSFAMGKSLYLMGNCLYYSQKDSSYYYYKESEKIFKLTKNDAKLAKVLCYKADILFYEGNYTESEIETFKALSLLKNLKNPDLEYRCYTIQGYNHLELDELNKALYYFNQADKALEKLNKTNEDPDKYYLYSVINIVDICNVYDKKREYAKSVEGLKKVATQKLKRKFSDLYSMVMGNMGYSLMKMGNYNEAKNHYNEALRIAKQNNDNQTYLYKIINYGEFYLLTKDTLKAKTCLKEALELSKSMNSGSEMLRTLDFLSQADKTKSAFYKNEYIRINDSIIKNQRNKREKFARIEYETDRIEQENQLLSKHNLNILRSFVGVILFSVIFFIIYRLKSKNKELQLIQDQQKANEKIYHLMLNQQSEKQASRNEERNRIAMELHDGIVNSIFTTRFNLKQLNSDQVNKKEQLVNELENVEKEIRRVSHDLQQNISFENTDLVDLISNLVTSQQNDSNTKFDFTADKLIDWSSVSGNDKIQIYRIIQEALQNVNKYSKAEKCFVFLLKTADKITLRIWDNGIGFNTEKSKRGIGLKNIEQRTKTLNGELKITSTPGKGCTIEVIF